MSLLSRSAGALARSSPLSAPAASASLLRSAAISHRRFLLADSTGQHQQQPQRAFHRSTPSRQSTATPAASAAPKLASSVPGASGLSGATPDSNGDYDGAKLFASELSHLTLKYNHALQYLTVTMNRPDLHNAFNEVVIQELTSVFRTLESACTVDPTSVLGGLRAVVLTGAGVSFSAGADLNWMKKMKTYTEEQNLADSKSLFAMFLLLHRCPVPLIARVNGAALGGGVGLVAACDLAVAVQEAKFGLTEVKLGLSPAVISSFVMSKLSPAATNFYFLTGQRFDAAEAQAQGLINQVVKDEAELDQRVKKIVEELALNSPAAVRATKQLIAQIRSDPRVPESESYCTRLIAKLRVSPEGQEGLNSFFEKRKATWIPKHLGNPRPKKEGEAPKKK